MRLHTICTLNLFFVSPNQCDEYSAEVIDTNLASHSGNTALSNIKSCSVAVNPTRALGAIVSSAGLSLFDMEEPIKEDTESTM